MAVKYDAFRQGVEPGGLLNTESIRLLILLTVYRMKTPLSSEVIVNALTTSGLVNYFEAASAVEVLATGGHLQRIQADGTEKFALTESGTRIAETLGYDLPRSVREKSLKYAMYYASRERRLSENEIDIKKLDTGYEVTLQVGKNENKVLRLTLYVPDSVQAETVRNAFLESPERLCEGVFAALFQTKPEA